MTTEDLAAKSARIEKKRLDEAKQQRKLLADISDRLTRLEAAQTAMSGTLGKVFNKVVHLEPDLHAVMRTLRLDHAALPYPQRLMAQRYRLLSQNEEDGITLALLEEARHRRGLRGACCRLRNRHSSRGKWQ